MTKWEVDKVGIDNVRDDEVHCKEKLEGLNVYAPAKLILSYYLYLCLAQNNIGKHTKPLNL